MTQILYDALKELEFINLEEYDPDKKMVCPWCGNSPEEGHQSYCSIMRALQIAERRF